MFTIYFHGSEEMRGVVKMSEDGWFTLTDISKKLDIPYNSLARYVSRHFQHIKTKRKHAVIYVHVDSFDTLKMIQGLYGKRYTQKTVDQELLGRGIPITVEIEDENRIQTLSVTLQGMKTELEALRKRWEQQEKFNQELLIGLEKQQQYIDERLEKRDRLLMESLKESMDARREIAATKKCDVNFGSNINDGDFYGI